MASGARAVGAVFWTFRVFPGALAALLLAAFFAFVGFHKALSPLTDLAVHRVWTLALPEWLGRMVGWSEMLLAAGLTTIFWKSVRRVAQIAALLLILNQILAAVVHAGRGELGALPQNAAIIALLTLVAWAASTPSRGKGEEA